MIRQVQVAAVAMGAVLAIGCAHERAVPTTVVVAAVSEPPSILPPLTFESVGRDVSDLVWERLANLAAGAASIDTSAYEPALAWRWERIDSLTLRFHLRPDARWQDGVPVTARDVVFSFDAYRDSVIDALARPALAAVTASAEDSLTVLVHFGAPSPEQLYDATYHVRIIPAHVWQAVPRADWEGDTAVAHLVGSGPYRVVSWQRGESLTLEADPHRKPGARPEIARVVFRFVQDPDAALNLILSHEADLLETLLTPQREARVRADTTFGIKRYPSAVYGFLAFNLERGHGALNDRAVRRGLVMGVDRQAIAVNAFGPGTLAPPGPISSLAWIGTEGIHTLPHDTAAARAALAGRRVGFDILVPSTSPSRLRIAQALQEQWRQLGVRATVTSVDFPVFQERLAAGRFDSYIGAYLDEPTLRGLRDQWGDHGKAPLDYGHYAGQAFDSLLALASAERDTAAAGPLYRDALSALNADAPAIFLYSPVNAAAVRRTLGHVTINPYSWISTLASWTIEPVN